MTIAIDKPQHFSFSEILFHLDRGYDDCLLELRDRTIRKVVEVDQDLVLLEISENDQQLLVKVLAGNADEEVINAHVDDWLDLNRDLTPFYDLDVPQIQALTTRYAGLRLVGIPDLFEALSWSIIGQQINLAFAHRIKRNLVTHFGRGIRFEGNHYLAFPSAKDVVDLDEDVMRTMKFSRQKITYLKEIARQVSSGTLDKGQLSGLVTTEAMRRRLIEIKGIGEWTANYALMKTLRSVDAIPFGDSGLNQGMKKILGIAEKPSRESIESFFAKAPGWEAYLTFYIWRSLSD